MRTIPPRGAAGNAPSRGINAAGTVLRSASVRHVALWPVILVFAFSVSACGVADYASRAIVDLQDSTEKRVNRDLEYGGYELEWKDIDDSGFMAAYEEKLAEEMDRRVPRVLQGNRPVRIVVAVSELHNPGALARNLLFNNDPSIRIEVIVQDTDIEEEIYGYRDEIVDRLQADPHGGISFRLQSVPVRLANATVQSLMDKLRALQVQEDPQAAPEAEG